MFKGIIMQHKLPSLSYDYGALEPYIDAQTMEIHHSRHHQGYVNNLNKALAKHPDLQVKPVEELLSNLDAIPEDIRVAIGNHGGGHYNHSLFWTIMNKDGGGEPVGLVGDAINKFFGTFAAMQDAFNTTAKKVFGSGWAWLSVDSEGMLIISSTCNQDSPVSRGLQPILGLDVWEHAYYLKYQNKRPDYINAWWHVINWEQVEKHYRAILK